mgnify:CR=1 FL=1
MFTSRFIHYTMQWAKRNLQTEYAPMLHNGKNVCLYSNKPGRKSIIYKKNNKKIEQYHCAFLLSNINKSLTLVVHNYAVNSSFIVIDFPLMNYPPW